MSGVHVLKRMDDATATNLVGELPKVNAVQSDNEHDDGNFMANIIFPSAAVYTLSLVFTPVKAQGTGGTAHADEEHVHHHAHGTHGPLRRALLAEPVTASP
eukprot:gene25854-31638_t